MRCFTEASSSFLDIYASYTCASGLVSYKSASVDKKRVYNVIYILAFFMFSIIIFHEMQNALQRAYFYWSFKFFLYSCYILLIMMMAISLNCLPGWATKQLGPRQ